MSDEDPPGDAFSTLVQSGKNALTFTEMQAFVKDIEIRPTDRLINDLPGLMALHEAKYQLVVMVLRKKTRPDDAERPALLERLTDLAQNAEDASVQSRARAFLEKPAS
jgi:hypothetical protein